MAELPVAAQARDGVGTQQAGVDLPRERLSAALELGGVDAPQRLGGELLEPVVVAPQRARAATASGCLASASGEPDPAEHAGGTGVTQSRVVSVPVDVEGGDDRAGGRV